MAGIIIIHWGTFLFILGTFFTLARELPNSGISSHKNAPRSLIAARVKRCYVISSWKGLDIQPAVVSIDYCSFYFGFPSRAHSDDDAHVSVDIMPPVFRKPVRDTYWPVQLAIGMWIRWLMWNVNCWHLGSFHFFNVSYYGR